MASLPLSRPLHSLRSCCAVALLFGVQVAHSLPAHPCSTSVPDAAFLPLTTSKRLSRARRSLQTHPKTSLGLFGGGIGGEESTLGDEDDSSSDATSFIEQGAWRKRDYGSRGISNRKQGSDRFDQLRDQITKDALVDRVLLGSSTSSTTSDERERNSRLIKLQVIGKGQLLLPTLGERCANDDVVEVPCILLSDTSTQSMEFEFTTGIQSLPVPLSENDFTSKRQMKLLSFAYHAKPISKSLFLTIAPLLTGRDGSLWDNLPWASWTIDPQKRIRDEAGNPVLDLYHPGKKDAYDRMMGKDWYGRSLSGGNLRARLEYWLDGLDDISLYDGSGSTSDNADGGESTDSAHHDLPSSTSEPIFNDDAAAILARRILEVERNEATSAVAEAEQKLALACSQGFDDTGNSLDGTDGRDSIKTSSDDEVEARRSDLAEVEAALLVLDEIEQISDNNNNTTKEKAVAALHKFLSAVTTSSKEQETAPYRGAYGYDATIDTPEEMFLSSILPYRSPFDLLLEIISEQLNGEVVGVALENSSLFDGTLVLEGAVILRRRGRPVLTTIAGESIQISDSDDDYGSQGIKEGEIFVVECDADEAIGLSLAADVPVSVDQSVWEASGLKAHLLDLLQENDDIETSTIDSIPSMKLSRVDSSRENKAPKTTNTNGFSEFFEPKASTSVFNTDNPVKSLEQYDSLSVQEKARMLLSLQSFQERLPRPRTLRDNPRALDDLLVPLVDESVRREYLVRDAEKRGDKERADRLRAKKSNRQIARERAAAARECGDDEEAKAWEEEAELQANKRADVTQDEGEYSRFLDRDEWYERERIARVKRLKRSSFGNLLDGIE